MAFSLSDRFPPTQRYYRLFDPCAYNNNLMSKSTPLNQAPFLSSTPRNIQSGKEIWSHALYYADYPSHIPNCTSLKAKKPRFPYECFSNKDLEDFLCKCGIANSCECAIEEDKGLCQAKVQKRLYKGYPPRPIRSFFKADHCFHTLKDSNEKYMHIEKNNVSPPFFNTKVHESTAFYQGCKWSNRTSLRWKKSLKPHPGPTDYTVTRTPTEEEICLEKMRAYKRQTSKQLRFMELVQKKNILEGLPGPSSYNPLLPKSTGLKCFGPTADRFPNKKDNGRPGPADYWLRRDLDPIGFFKCSCRSKLPKCFRIPALKLGPRIEEDPSPASYYPNHNLCNILICSRAPFGTSSKRFHKSQIEESDEEEKDEEDEEEIKSTTNYGDSDRKNCVLPTWEFRSKTIRMQKLSKKLDEPSPADVPQSKLAIKRSRGLQYIAPFFTSECRFYPWFNWISVHGKLKTPGPCSYNLQKPKCNPAVHRGPLFRSPRFLPCKCKTPAPNEYNINGGIEMTLKTHNKRLKTNIENQHVFTKKSPKEKRKLSFQEQEDLLINKSIALLETKDSTDKICKPCNMKSSDSNDQKKKPKLLRCFLYNQQMSTCF